MHRYPQSGRNRWRKSRRLYECAAGTSGYHGNPLEPKIIFPFAELKQFFIPNSTGRRLAAALLGYIVLVIFLLTWNPFSLALPEHLQLSFRIGPRDALANVLLFLPVGFLFCLGQGSPRRRDPAWSGDQRRD